MDKPSAVPSAGPSAEPSAGPSAGPSENVTRKRAALTTSPGQLVPAFKVTMTPGGSIMMGEEQVCRKTGSGRIRVVEEVEGGAGRPKLSKRSLVFGASSSLPDRDIEQIINSPDSGSEEEEEDDQIEEIVSGRNEDGWELVSQPLEAQYPALRRYREIERESYAFLEDVLDEPNESTSHPAPSLEVQVQVEMVDEGRVLEEGENIGVIEDGVEERVIVNPEIVHGEEYVWQTDFSLFQGQAETYLRQPGPTIASTCPLELFSAIWDEEIMQKIVRQTNLYAWQTIAPLSEQEGGISAHARINQWRDTDVNEMYTFFAVLIYMSLDYRSRLDEYWTTGVLGMPGFRSLMSRDRFLLILKFIHFVDNTDLTDYMTSYEKKVHKIIGLVEHCNQKFCELYVPKQFLSLDESLLLWKGRLSWVQCIRTKAARFGIKTFELCEGDTGYLLRTLIYAGKNSSGLAEAIHGFQNPTAKVVLKLMKGFLDAGHGLVMDNWYNQLSLTRFLKAHHTDVIGTLNRRRANVPVDIRSLDERRMPRGDIVARHSKDISVVSWKDVKLVTMVSTYLSMYLMERKRATKWYLKVFRRYLNTSLMNAYIFLKCNTQNDETGCALTHRQFRYAVADLLVRKHKVALPEPAAQRQAFATPVHRLDRGAHIRVETEVLPNVSPDGSKRKAKRRCARCSAAGKRRMFTSMCHRCDVGLCVGRCFDEYHRLDNLKLPT